MDYRGQVKLNKYKSINFIFNPINFPFSYTNASLQDGEFHFNF